MSVPFPHLPVFGPASLTHLTRLCVVPFLALACGGVTLPSLGQEHATPPPWTEVTQRDTLTLFNRALPGEPLREFLVRGTADVGAEELLPVLGDFDAYPLWMPGCDRAELVERGDPTKPIYATRLFLSLGSPFPFSDRDIELLVENRLNPADGLWEFTSRALSASESSRKPNKGVVRIEKSTGRWSFRRAGPGATAIEYQWHSDPGGNLPAWLANRVTRTVPLEAVGNLIARAKCLRAAPADNPGCVFE